MADREPDPPPPNPPHNERKPNILIIGSLNIDLTTTVDRIPEAGETMHAVSFNTNSGGKGANQAVAVGRGSRSKPASSLTIDEGTGLASTFGLASTYSLRAEEVDGGVGEVNVAMLGAVGNDIYGSQLVEDLKASGVDTANIRKIEGTPTGTAVIIVDQSSGENRIMLVAGANDEMDIAS